MSTTGIVDAKTSGQALAMVIALVKHDIGNREARMLLAHAAGIDSYRLPDLEVGDFTDDLITRYLALAQRRIRREPMSHILGYRDFFNARFEVTKDILDPRPETEVLVRLALEMPFENVLDLGTGSGAILLSLLSERPGACGVGTDISPAALEIARRNAKALGVADRAQLEQSDWLGAVAGQFQLIVSNPPYISVAELAGLAPDVREYEPRLALTDEADGLQAYRAIAADVRDHLTPGGRVLLEIGPTQAAAVSDLLARAGLEHIATHPDLDGRDRVISARAPA